MHTEYSFPIQKCGLESPAIIAMHVIYMYLVVHYVWGGLVRSEDKSGRLPRIALPDQSAGVLIIAATISQ